MEINYLVIDVDGTMTDAGIYYDNQGNELKKFCTRDGVGFFAAYAAGIRIIVLTGRECAATERRMKELKVNYLFQNVKDKYSFLKNFMHEHDIEKNNIAYIGDDINDFEPMKLTGFIGCPSDSCQEIKEIADYVSDVKGGYGCVRDIIETMLRREGIWSNIVATIYGIGT